MRYQLSEKFRNKYKKQNVRIRKAIDTTLILFYKNHLDLSLNNHELQRELEGWHSINISDPKNDYRAIYEEIYEEEYLFAYFETFGTHKELFLN
jgi:mRNA-degrading endonuclease YafQ of YafQ-DinJ toxin-antitoxin module